MGLIAMPFAVDIQKVKQVFGSRDRNMLYKINTTRLYEHYSNEEMMDGDYRYSLDEVLEDIIFNYVKPEDRSSSKGLLGMFKPAQTSGLKENMGYAYGYGLLVICDYTGTHLLPQSDGFYYGRDWEEAHAILRENGLNMDLNQIFESHAIFDIPATDFPAISCYSKEEIAQIYAVCSKITINEQAADMNSNDFDEVQLMLKSIRDSFKTCFDTQLELVAFTH
jgi:hypothetical protein